MMLVGAQRALELRPPPVEEFLGFESEPEEGEVFWRPFLPPTVAGSSVFSRWQTSSITPARAVALGQRSTFWVRVR